MHVYIYIHTHTEGGERTEGERGRDGEEAKY